MNERVYHVEKWEGEEEWKGAGEEGTLTVLGEIEDPNSCYDFHILRVWQDEDGNVWWGEDSGCSCPAPFEDTLVSELTEVTRDRWDEFHQAVLEFEKEAETPENGLSAAKTELLLRVSRPVFSL